MNNTSSKVKTPLFYGWIVVAAAFLIALMGYGMRYSFSVFYVVILNEFGWSRASTAGAFSTALIIYGIGAPIAGSMVDRVGSKLAIIVGGFLLATGLALLSQASAIWHFYLFFGLLVALGTCFVGNASLIPLLSNWFVRRRGTAIGLYFAAVAGAPALAPVIQYLIDTLGWRSAYLVLAAMAVVVIVALAALLLRPRPEAMGLLPDGVAPSGLRGSPVPGAGHADDLVVDRAWVSRQWTVGQAMRTRQFWALVFANLFLGAEMNLLYMHQVAHAVDVGFSQGLASSALGLAGLATMLGALGGFVSDRIGRESTYTIGVVGSILGILVLTMMQQVSQLWMLYFYAICFGFFYGLSTPAIISSHADIFLGKTFGAINGCFLAGFGVGGAIGPYLGGYFYDAVGSYTFPFILAMFLAAASGTCLWVAAPRRIRLVAGRASYRLEAHNGGTPLR